MPFRFRLSLRWSARGPLGCVARPALAAVVLAACGDATAPLPTDGPPSELSYSTGGFVLTTYDVRLAGDTVVLTSATAANGAPALTTTRRVPSAAEWRAFWQTVRDVGVARWPAQCTDNSMADGGTVRFTLAWGGTRRTGTYYAAYPRGNGTCVNGYDESSGAVRFQTAVFTLTGVQFL